MNRKYRKTVIAGNWKMNKTPAEATQLIGEILAANEGKDVSGCEVIACVPYVDIDAAVKAAAGSFIKIGAENCHWAKSGAFTGEISAEMLAEMGVEYVVIGHSERRQYFGETDETVNLRTKAALAAGLKVILCLGEVKEERLAGITDEVVSMQTKLDLKDITAEELKNVIIFNSVQVPHYNYVGDSILGYKSHMGAGSITSNVKSDKTLVVVKDCYDTKEEIETGLKKFGAMLGDNVEVGCNSVLNPGTVVGKNSNIYPLSRVRGVVPENCIFKGEAGVVKKY